ncbi:MAG TPA: histidine kinase [Solirubrobacteraceae bacterium]|nr:histidine kinase [Solirubrobacteraceae bacterium]
MASPQSHLAGRTGGTLLAAELTLSVVCCLAVTIVWAVTGGPFWPMWVWTSLGLPIALQVAWRRAWAQPRGPRRRLAVQGWVSGILAGYLVLVWAMGGLGYFWPAFPAVGLAMAFALHAVFYSPRQTDLSARVDELTRTRRGALDVQSAELRRIERDLHDGAQARLVALTMQLGRAEARLEDRPETAELIRQAREEATAAVAELRDLARGIAPPVLADRGLVAAVEALAQRSGVDATVESKLTQRLAPVVESAAYFVTAESLTNGVKHADGASVRITIRRAGARLIVEVADNGPGGADPRGNGLSGLRQRVEALDGTLDVDSPEGIGTTIRAVLPCES